MALLRFLVTIAVLSAGGCAPSVFGVVRDAATERPIGGAVVEIRNRSWGIRNSQLVWDAEKISRATTDHAGPFRIKVGGGLGVRVSAIGHEVVESSLCGRSPMIVRMGGPYADLSPDRRLVFRQEISAANSYLATVEDIEIRASGGAFTGKDDLRIETNAGVRFVSGTGTIPRPPAIPYPPFIDLDLKADCGWLFVGDGPLPQIVIGVKPLSWEQSPGKPRHWVMLYSPLPDR